jgi:hypothetical protein
VGKANVTPLAAVRRAATGRLNLFVAGAAAASAAALHSLPLLALGGVTYVALVAFDVVRGGGASREGAPFGDLRSFGDRQTAAAVQIVLAAQSEIQRVAGESPEAVKGSLSGMLSSADSLVDRAARLAARAEDLSRYLASKDPRRVRSDVEALRQRAAGARDPDARAQYEGALAARVAHLRSLEELDVARERVQARLLSIASTLEGLPAKIVHLRALDADAMDRQSGDVNEELERVGDEVASFEETLQTLGGPRS